MQIVSRRVLLLLFWSKKINLEKDESSGVCEKKKNNNMNILTCAAGRKIKLNLI